MSEKGSGTSGGTHTPQTQPISLSVDSSLSNGNMNKF